MKKTLALILAVAMMASLFVMPAAAESDKPFEGVKLTYWVRLHENLTGLANNYAETRWYDAVHEATGIEIEFIHPATAAGDDKSEFNMLIASGEYPDIIETNWTTYPGGATAAVEDGVVMPLDDALANGKAPNLKAILDGNPIIDKSVKNSNGQYYVFPFLRGTTFENNNCLYTGGFFLRGDILEELGMEAPQTIDEWYAVLSAVKAAHPDMIPFVTRTEWMNQIFCPGFDNYWDYYVEDGVVKNGLLDDSHYEYLQTMAKWYAEGLIDPDYLTHSKSGDGRKIMAAGNAFATNDASGGGTSNIIPPLLEAGLIDSEADIVTTTPVRAQKDTPAKFAKMNGLYDASGSSAAITTQCTNVDAALYLLDWMYSEEGHMINCFGIEGESYNMVDGYPVYTDIVLKNADGLSVAQALSNYARGHQNGPVVQDTRVNDQYYSYSAQIAGMKLWTETTFGDHMYPAGASIPADYTDEFANISSNMKTYKEECEAKWITGKEELTAEVWEAYKAQMEAYGFSRAVELKQAAYDAFMAN